MSATFSGAEKSRESNLRQEALDFIKTADTRLAPIYGPLAGQIVSEFGLADKQGVGIDLGSGPGNLIIELCRRTRRMQWINADINPYFFPHFLAEAEKAGVKNRVKAVEADAQALPFLSDYADIIVSRGSFQFWTDKNRAFSEIRRVLKPGGMAFIGRGFPDSLPVETARRVRSAGGEGPKYDVGETAAMFKEIMQALEITDYRIRIPKPTGAEGVNYGIWLEFRKKTSPGRTSIFAESPYYMGTIVVTGEIPRNPVAEPRVEPEGLEIAFSTVNQAEIARQGAKNVVEALEYVPGAFIETRGRKVKQFFTIRGQQYPYPDYALDGAWQREFLELPYFFPSEDVERIEVMRSSAALLTGLSGLAGVVNIVPRRYRERETSIRTEYGSFRSYNLSLSHGGTVKNLSYALSLGIPHTEGPKGRYAGEGFTNLRGSLYWTPDPKWTVTAHLFHLDGHRGLAQALPPASENLRLALEKFDPFRATLVTLKTFYQPNSKASTELIWNLSWRDHTFRSESVSPPQTNREWDYEWSASLTQALALSSANVLRLGGLYNHWVAPNGKRFYVGKRCDLETCSAVIVDEHSLGPLNLDLGLRWIRTFINNYGAFNINESPQGLQNVTPIKDMWEPAAVVANAGAAYDLSRNVSLHFNLSSGNIRPERGDLDVNLREPKVERRIKLDLGIKLQKEKTGQVTLAFFLTRQKNALVLSGKTVTVAGRVLETYLNRNQRQNGIEIDLRSSPFSGSFQLFFNLLAMDSRAELSDRMVRNREIPQFITSLGLYSIRDKFDFSIFMKAVSSYESTRFVDTPKGKPPIPQPLGGYQTLNLTLGRSFGARPESRVYLEIINLTDRKFSTVVGYPDYGRRFTLGLRSSFR